MEHQAALKIQRAWWSYKDKITCMYCKRRLDRSEEDLCDTCLSGSMRYYECYCGDWLCAGGCGVLRCGCIDVCRCRDSWDRY